MHCFKSAAGRSVQRRVKSNEPNDYVLMMTILLHNLFKLQCMLGVIDEF